MRSMRAMRGGFISRSYTKFSTATLQTPTVTLKVAPKPIQLH